VVLHHRAHGAVEDNDAFAQQALQLFGPVLYWLHRFNFRQSFRTISTSALIKSKYHFIMIRRYEMFWLLFDGFDRVKQTNPRELLSRIHVAVTGS
jgi:hypothetical protein